MNNIATNEKKKKRKQKEKIRERQGSENIQNKLPDGT